MFADFDKIKLKLINGKTIICLFEDLGKKSVCILRELGQ